MDKLSFDDARTVDSLCDELERRWKERASQGAVKDSTDPEPSSLLAIFLKRCPAHLRNEAFRELLRLEVELRQQSGIAVHRDEYITHYAEFSDTVDEVFETDDVRLAPTIVSPSRGKETPDAKARIQSPPATVRTFGRFQIIEELGRGAFGTVMRALDTTLDREVALKLPRFPNHDRSLVDRFLAEAQIAAQLQHPNIVSVWDRGDVDGQYFISSAFVQGETLRQYLLQHVPDFRLIATWIRSLAEALAYAHEQSIIHRDIKPANIIINQQQRLMIMDFGLAKRADQSTDLTTDGLILGTPSYMSPEQALGVVANISVQTDQYSLGIVFAEMLTGRLPWQGTVQEVISRLQSLPAPPQLRHPTRTIPADLEAICQKMLQPVAKNRYTTCQAAADDLTRWLDGHPVKARKVSFGERSAMWCRRNRLISALIGTTLAVLLIGLVSVSAALVEADNQRADAVTQGDKAKAERKKAVEQESIAVAEKVKADDAARLARKESARTLMLLAAKEIEEGRFHQALQLLSSVPQEHRNWVWRVQQARIPEELCRIPLGKVINEVHTSPKVIFDPSGERIAVSHPFDGALEPAKTRLYSVTTGELIHQPGAEFVSAAPREAGFTKDGRYLGLLVTNDKKRYPDTLAVYNTKTETTVATLAEVYSFAPLKHNAHKFLIQRRSAEAQRSRGDSEYLIWSFLTNDLKKIGNGPWSYPFNFGVNAAETELSVRHRNQTTVYNIPSGKPLERPMLQRVAATHNGLSPDEKLVTGQLQELWHWNERGRVVAPGQAAVIAFPDRMVTRLESAPTVASYLARFAEHLCNITPGKMRGFSISNDGRYVNLSLFLTGQDSGYQSAICWWNAHSGEFIGRANGLGVSVNADRFAVVEDTDIVVRKAPLHLQRFRDQRSEDELAKWEPIDHYGRQVRPYVFYCRETPWVIVPHHDAKESVDPEKHVIYTGPVSEKFHFHQIATAVDHASSRVAFMVSIEFVEVYSLLTGERVARLRCGRRPANTNIAFHQDGKHLLLGNYDGLEIWSIADQSITHKFRDIRSHIQLAGNIAASPDGKMLALMNQRGVTWIDAEQNRVLRKTPVAKDRVVSRPRYQLSFSHDSRWLVYGSSHGTLTVLSARTGDVVHSLQTDSKDCYGIFHPTEPLLILGRGGRLVVYETETWKVVFDQVLAGGVDTFRFSESGNAVAVGANIGWTRRWFEFAGLHAR